MTVTLDFAQMMARPVVSGAPVEALVKQTSAALDVAKVRCADETSWRQAGRSRWLSVAAAVALALGGGALCLTGAALARRGR